MTGSAATATVSPTTPCGRCWPRPPTSPRRPARRETRDAPAPARPGARARGGPPAHARALRARLHDAAQALRTPDDWGACLGLATRLPGEDFANILLIHAERPGATLVRDYQQWTAAGRQVRKGEHGIEIFAIPPRPRAQRQDQGPGRAWTGLARGRPGYLRLGPVPDHRAARQRRAARPSRDPPAGVWDALCWLARRQGYAVELEHGPPPDGTVFWAARRIRIPPGLSGEQAVWALAHQLGHVLLHHDPGYPAGTTTSGCAGVRKAEADSVAWITCARHGITPAGGLPYPASWPAPTRAPSPPPPSWPPGTASPQQPPASPATPAASCTDDPAPVLRPPRPARGRTPARPARHRHARQQPGHPARRQPRTRARRHHPPHPRRRPCLLHRAARRQLGTRLPAHPRHHRRRHPGLAHRVRPAGWTALTGHLRGLGHHDDAIQAAGLASRSSRGTLIDRFRDRIMLPVHDAAGMLAGFTGRAHPDAGPDTPKYLNSPQTATYKKSHLLFGLYQARPDLARGAIPVIVEGPSTPSPSASPTPAVTPGWHPAAPHSPASRPPSSARPPTCPAPESSSRSTPTPQDAKPPSAPTASSARSPANSSQPLLDGKDPAEILQRDGPAALRIILREHRQPLSALLIDASIEQWGRRLDDTDGPLLAMRSTASLIASLLPDDTASQICDITAGRELQTTDDLLRPVDNPEIPQIARILPADTATRSCGPPGSSASTAPKSSPKSPTPPPATPFRQTPAPRTAQ